MNRLPQRRLGASEAFFAGAQSVFGALTVGAACRLNGTLDAELLADCYREIYASDPHMSGEIRSPGGKRPIYVATLNRDADVPIESRRDDQHWKDALRQQMNTPFLQDESSDGEQVCRELCRFQILRGDTHHELIFGVHHASLDGRRLLVLVETLLDLYRRRQLGETVLIDPQDFSQTLEERYGIVQRLRATARLVTDAVGDAFQSIGKKELFPIGEVQSDYASSVAFLSLTAAETSRLIGKCKQEQTTVNAALASAAMRAYVNITGASDNVSMQTTMDSVDPPVQKNGNRPDAMPESRMGTFSFSQTEWFRPRDRDLWDLARTYRARLLKRHSTNTVPPLGYHSIAMGYLRSNTRDGKFASVADVCLSNLGRASIETQYNDLVAEELFFASSQPRLGGNVVINAATLRDSLSMTCVTPPHVPAELGGQLLGEIHAALVG
ncbi:tuba protein [Rhodopirellula sallentina]|uniref:Tuba protein n=1 Tax=Rhodopirellula sallentina SM41 TaxID=1263870 RepID=M5TSF9_9BACT|nr:tuba protein [Rhodopirellula sallentina]EMI52127.1 tuba protein [Rhodopirellula sallentina SM41]